MMVPLNDCEWLIEPFYESQIRGVAWRLEDAVPSAELQPQWQALSLRWEAAAAGDVIGRLVRDVDIDLLEADRLCVRASLGEQCALSLEAVVDGAAQTVVDRAPGQNRFAEYEGTIQGGELERLRLELITPTGASGPAHFLWLIAVDGAGRQRRHRLTPVYDATWPGLLRDDDRELTPQLDLFLPPGGVEALRRRAASPTYRPVWQQLQGDAAALETTCPERSVREHLSRSGLSEDGRYSHDAGPPVDPAHALAPEGMQAAALVALVNNDAAMGRLALRHALAAMHCTHWEDSFMSTRPGALWDHRAFTAMTWQEAVLRTFDWAGALLTSAGRELIARSISRKVLPMVDWSLRKYAYMRGNNQGIYFGWAGVMAACALGRLLPHGDEGLEGYLDVLRESVSGYFLPDGGADEGPGYHDKSCGRAIDGFVVAARYRGEPETALVPDALLRAPNYYRHVVSTVRPGGYVTVADGGGQGENRAHEGALPRLARLAPEPTVRRMAAALTRPDGAGRVPGSLTQLTEGPDALPGESPEPPAFGILSDTGMLCSSRPTPHGPVRAQLIGAKASAGHSHEDKGSLLLEAFGEDLLIDRGICFYGDARGDLLKRACMHNMLTPDDRDGRPIRQRNPLPEPIIPTGRGDERTLDASVDHTAGWPGTLARAERRLRSEAPTRFTLTDLAERHEAGTVSVHFHSRYPWLRRGHGWVTETPRARLTLTPQWEPAEAGAAEDLFDGGYRPVHRLTLRASPGIRFELTHVLELSP